MEERILEIKKLLSETERVKPSEFISLIESVSSRISEEKKSRVFNSFEVEEGLVNLKVKGNIIVVGDIHGDIESLIYILKDSKFLEEIKTKKDSLILFLGDYGDRGIYSPEVYYIIFRLKTTYPENVVFLRGNHEGPTDLLAIPHDLPYHLERKFKDGWKEVYEKLLKFFDILYHVAILESKYLFLHGGIPSEAKTIQDLAYAARYHPAKRFLEEILWSDPEEGIKGVYPSPRGAGKVFGEDVTRCFLKKINVKMLIRGHEPCYEGIKVNHQGKILTVFSRKGKPYFNPYAAYLKIKGSGQALDGYQLKEVAKVF